MTSIRTIIFALCEKIPGINAQYIEQLQYFEFIEYKNLLEQKIKAEKEDYDKTSQENANMFKSPKIQMPKVQMHKYRK